MTNIPTSPDHPDFEGVFEAFRMPVFRLCLGLTGNHSDAEDATQETFLAILRGLAGFRGECRLSTWIYRIAIRSALRVRARRPRTETLDVEPVGDARDPALENERSRQVRLALARKKLAAGLDALGFQRS